ncbi:MAG: hypothetical protein KDI68_14380 [Gammaproteobacteria bacterium]|nr:hypothetical protein [Gammaproteobacteria bacterium]
MKYSTPRIVQSQRSHQLLWWLLVPAVLLGMLAAGYYARFQQEASGHQTLQSVIDAQQKEIEGLNRERAESTEKIAHLERSAQIDREALEQVKLEMKGFQEERSELDEELSVLRGMLSGKGAREGLQIQRLLIKQGSRAGEFRYKFTVTQVMQNGEMASGWAFFAVDGLMDGKPTWLPLRDITAESAERIRVRFKHFQDVEGVIKLPPNFKPLKVIVEVKPSNSDLPEVKQRFDWEIEG